MRDRLEGAVEMRNTVQSVLSESPHRNAVQTLYGECHRFALAYLRCKRRGHYLKERIGLSLEDLAVDCIADLFERDEDGRFVQLSEYFNSAGWPNLSEEAATIALRRLVFSKVSDGLFRRHREADPQVAKIIRNLKLATKNVLGVTLSRRGKALWLVVRDSDAPASDVSLRNSDVIPPELVEAQILAHLHESTTMEHVLTSFVELVRAWPSYRNGYPISTFARVVNDAFRRFGEVSSDSSEREELLLPSEIDQAVEKVTRSVESEMYSTYVGRKKLVPSRYQAYCLTAGDILRSQFLSGAADRISYYEALKFHLPELTVSSYRDDHRHVLEYLAKVSRRRLVTHFERALSVPE